MTSKTKLNIYSIAQLLLLLWHTFDSCGYINADLLKVFTNFGKIIFLALIVSDFILKPFTKKKLFLSLAVVLSGIIFTISSGNEEFLLIILAVLAARDLNVDKVIARDLIIRTAVLSSLMIAFTVNATPDAWQVERISLGLYHPNTLGGMLMVIGIEMMYLFRNTKNPLPYLLCVLLLYFNWNVCKSRTSFGVLCFAIICFLLLKLNFNLLKNKVSKFVVRNSYLLFAILSFALVFLYKNGVPFALKLNDWFSGRLYLSNNYLNLYDINLFGNAIATFSDIYIAADGSLYYTVDMVFIANLLSYGLVGLAFFSFFYNLSFRNLYRNKKYYMILCLLLMFVYGVMETGSFRFADNPFLVILAVGIFETNNDKETEFYLNKYIVTIFSSLLICLFFFRFVILNNNSQFIISENTNMYNQYKFLLAYYNRMHSLNFANYDWSLGLGSSTYNLYSYGILSPFNLLILLLKEEWLSHAVLWLNILKIVILSIGSTLWLSKLSNNREHIVSLALAISFSSLLLSYYATAYFDYYCLLPFVLFFIEKAINDNKHLGLAMSIVVLLLCAPTMLIETIIFLSLYSVFRIFYLDKFDVGTLIKVFLEIILSVGMASFITVPCLKSVAYTTNDSFVSVLISLLTPVTNYSGSNFSIYTSIGALIIIPCIFKNFKKQQIVLVCTLLASLIYSLIFNATFGYFALILIGMCLLLDILDNQEELDFKFSLIGFAICMAILVINYFVTINSKVEINSQNISFEIAMAVIILIVILGIKKEGSKIITFTLIMELCLSMASITVFTPLVNNTLTINASTASAIKENDSGIYRTINGTAGTKNQSKTDDTFNLNYNLTDLGKQIAGISINNSTYNSGSSDYIDLINIPANDYYVGYDKNFLSYYNIAGVKYWYVDDEETQLAPPTYFEKVDDQNYYKNKYFIELGYVNNNLINAEYLNTLNDFDKEWALREYVALDSSDNTDFNSAYSMEYIHDPVYYGPLEHIFDTPVSGVTLTVVNGGVPIIDVELLYNGALIRTEHFYQYNFVNVTIGENELVDKVIVKYEDKDNVGYGISGLYMSKPEAKIEEELYNSRINNSFTNILFKQDYISADINIDQDNSFVYTYVPYDDNWSITDNGREVEKLKANYGFTGFYLSSGSHHIEFTYNVPGLTIGIIISISCILGYAAFIIIKTCNDKKTID